MLFEAGNTRSDHRLIIDHGLAKALRFGADDLQTNRSGYLSENQKTYLRRVRRAQLGRSLLFVGVIGGLIVVSLFGTGTRSVLAYLFSIGCTIALVARPTLRVWRGVAADIAAARVQHMIGIVRNTSRPDANYTDFTICIEDRQFTVPNTVYMLFHVGVTYRLYYAPQMSMIVSAEPSPQGMP